MKYIVIITLAIIHIVFGQPDFLLTNNWDAILLNQFFHANILHLIINCYVFYILYKPCKGFDKLGELLVAYLISIIVFPCSLKPIIGFSNVIYAVIGLRTPSFSNPWWKKSSTIIFFVVTFIMGFIPAISATTHIASFVIGTIFAIVGRYIRKIKYDTARATNS